ncbi:MAG: hypothetical protein EP314_08660 [Bacteroidetes bacterium]|nr:MAG: hypothetical protein EP314_08660 [Bacteroidota bacterium]
MKKSTFLINFLIAGAFVSFMACDSKPAEETAAEETATEVVEEAEEVVEEVAETADSLATEVEEAVAE